MTMELEPLVEHRMEALRTPEQVVSRTTSVGRLTVGNKIAEIGGKFEGKFKDLYGVAERLMGQESLQDNVHFEQDAWGNELVVSGPKEQEEVELQTQYMQPEQRQDIESRAIDNSDQTNVRPIGRHLQVVPNPTPQTGTRSSWLRKFFKR